MLSKIVGKFSRMQFIVLGFIIIILIGAILLSCPFSARSGEATPFLTSLFTSVSATCVTGLVRVDTYQHWSMIGQLILLILIQIGGLGFITFGVGVSLIFRKKIGLKQRGLIRESMNVENIGGVVRLVRQIIRGTILFEGIGAILLAIRFVPELGWTKGIWYGVFHSISAFCNAGFDLMGYREEFSSFTAFTNEPYVQIILMALIAIGGIGFFVWSDLRKCGWHVKKYTLHTKIVLLTNVILFGGGAVLFFFVESGHLYADMPLPQQILNAVFSSFTPRTAGFNTVDTGALSEAGKLLTIMLMFIGGSPGSTAGGVKTTTIVVLLLHVKATLLRTEGSNVFGRRVEESAIAKAAVVVTINMTAALVVTFIVSATQGFSLVDTAVEVVSAISTVGMSAGLTGSLNLLSMWLVMLLMFIGRMGSLSFALAFTDKKRLAHVRLPEGKINIG